MPKLAAGGSKQKKGICSFLGGQNGVTVEWCQDGVKTNEAMEVAGGYGGA